MTSKSDKNFQTRRQKKLANYKSYKICEKQRICKRSSRQLDFSSRKIKRTNYITNRWWISSMKISVRCLHDENYSMKSIFIICFSQICIWFIASNFALFYDVFQNYYFVYEFFQKNKNIFVIDILIIDMFYLKAFVMTLLIRRWSQWQKQMIWIEWTMIILNLIATNFAKFVEFLIAFQKVTYSIDVTIMFFFVISMLNE